MHVSLVRPPQLESLCGLTRCTLTCLSGGRHSVFCRCVCVCLLLLGLKIESRLAPAPGRTRKNCNSWVPGGSLVRRYQNVGDLRIREFSDDACCRQIVAPMRFLGRNDPWCCSAKPGFVLTPSELQVLARSSHIDLVVRAVLHRMGAARAFFAPRRLMSTSAAAVERRPCEPVGIFPL